MTNYSNLYPCYSFFFPIFFFLCVVRHFRRSLLNNLYCDILHLYSIVIAIHKFSNICKPEEGWYRQPKYCYEKTTHVVLNQLCSSLWTSRFWLIRSLQEIQRLQLAGSSSTVFKVNSVPLLYPMSLSKFNLNKMADAASSEASGSCRT